MVGPFLLKEGYGEPDPHLHSVKGTTISVYLVIQFYTVTVWKSIDGTLSLAMGLLSLLIKFSGYFHFKYINSLVDKMLKKKKCEQFIITLSKSAKGCQSNI